FQRPYLRLDLARRVSSRRIAYVGPGGAAWVVAVAAMRVLHSILRAAWSSRGRRVVIRKVAVIAHVARGAGNARVAPWPTTTTTKTTFSVSIRRSKRAQRMLRFLCRDFGRAPGRAQGRDGLR